MADPSSYMGAFDNNSGVLVDEMGLGAGTNFGPNHGPQAPPPPYPSYSGQQTNATLHQKLQHYNGQPLEQGQSPQKLQHFMDPNMPPHSQQQVFQNPAQSGAYSHLQFQNQGISAQYASQNPRMAVTWRGQQNSSNSFPGMIQQGLQFRQQGQMQQRFPYGFQQQSPSRLQHFPDPMSQSSSNPYMPQGPSHPQSPASGPPSNVSPTGGTSQQTELQPRSEAQTPQFPGNSTTQETDPSRFVALQGGMNSQVQAPSQTGNSPRTLQQYPIVSSSPHNVSPMPAEGMRQSHNPAHYQGMGMQMDPYMARMQGVPMGNMQEQYMQQQQQQSMAQMMTNSQVPPNQMAPMDSSNQMKASEVLLHMQRIQQEIQRLRDVPSPQQQQQIAMMQKQFQQLYQFYMMQQHQKQQEYQIQQQMNDHRMYQQQQHQDKANKIVVEAMAKAAMLNNANGQGGVIPNSGYPQHGQGFSQRPYEQNVPLKPQGPIKLPPNIVHKPVPSNSSRPPATVLSKPSTQRNRRDSSDHEPSSPTSPSQLEEDYMFSNTAASRRSLRERKKKTYNEDFDYNLSDEEHAGKERVPSQVTVPPEEMGPVEVPGVMEDVEEAMIVEKILSSRIKQAESGDMEEFLVKYKNYSYLHCEWATVDKLLRGDKRIQMKVKRYLSKRNLTVAFLNELDDEPFNPDYCEVDRLLDVSTGFDQSSGEPITHFLVKWRSLAYEDSTWELQSDVEEPKMQEFYRNRELPPPHLRQFHPRPFPHEWQKLADTPTYKDKNVLREYQLEGVNWLTFCWFNRQNCILADEMGLGKTIQSITFLLEVKRYGLNGPFLVIAPLSTISNWQREFETWTDLNAVVYHGSASSRHLIQEYEFYYRDPQGHPVPGLYKFQALITTYEIIIADNVQLSAIPWRCVVIDEAHRLKNRNCKLLEGLNNLQMEHRILLTGTPLQNNVDELFSLLNFLEPSQFPSQGMFLAEFGDLKTESQVDRLKDLLKPMMLRRLKEDVEKNIAPKLETIVEVELTPIQKKFYRAILERNFSFLSKGAGSTSNVPNLMNTMMELRKCCNHPFLINGAEEKVMGEFSAVHGSDDIKGDKHLTAMVEASGKLVLIDKLLPKLKAGGHKVLVFSQMVRCLDILEDYLINKQYIYERIDGRVRGNLRQAAIDRFSKPESDRFVFLLCTRAGGLGINLTAADTVIIFDSDWNPQNDLQAQARCHRIGQSKSVKVYRLITRNSYEREMFDRASMKLGLDRAVLQSMNTSGKDMSNPALSKKEIEDLLKKGAYGAVMDDDESSAKFCEEDIDQILERRTRVVQIEAGEAGSTFSKASFISSKSSEDIDIDDPLFWQKWAEKADMDIDTINGKDERIIDAPRQRKQTKRFGNENLEFEMSDLDSEEEETQLIPRRRAWTRVECFRVEKNLLIYGWGAWKQILSSGRFKRKLLEREIESIARTMLIYCLSHYNGDEKVKMFVRELTKPSSARDRFPSEDKDSTYNPLPISTGSGKSKRSKRGSKTSSKKESKNSAIALLEVGSDYKTVDPELLILDESYKKHLQHHCNKILLRVRLLFYLKTDVIGNMGLAIYNGVQVSELPISVPVAEGDPPVSWWDEIADKSLLVGVYKHGYENYQKMRLDPCLCFLSRCGPPRKRSSAVEGFAQDPSYEMDVEKFEMEDDPSKDPDYHLPLIKKKDSDLEEEEEEEEESDMDDDKDDDKEDDKDVSGLPGSPRGKEDKRTESIGGGLVWPSASDLNTRVRRLIAGYQRIHKKQQLKKAAAEKEKERKERFEEAVRQKEQKKMEIAQKWSKREEVDFYRTVTAFGAMYNKEDDTYDWSNFRRLARLDKKNDDRLTIYYLDFMAMCRKVCGKSVEGDENRGHVDSISEERASRCLQRVVVLNMIREEVLPHELFDERMTLCQPSPEMPDWWVSGKHDKDLVFGVSKYGISRTDYHLLNDPDLSFAEIQAQVLVQAAAQASTEPSPMSSIPSQHGTPIPFESGISTPVVEKNHDEITSQGLVQPSAAMQNQGSSITNEKPGNTPMLFQLLSDGGSLDQQQGAQAKPAIKIEQAGIKSNDRPVELGSSPFSMTPIKQDESELPVISHPSSVNDDEDSRLSADMTPNPFIEPLVPTVRWPKDKVIIHRLEQICHCVKTGEWKQVERYEAVHISAPSPLPPGLEGEAMHSMLQREENMEANKAFKVKKLDGLKLTVKKNRKRKKKGDEVGVDGEVGDEHHKEPTVRKKPKTKLHAPQPIPLDGEWPQGFPMSAPGEPVVDSDGNLWAPQMPIQPEKKKRKPRQPKEDKGEKTPKKRGRKPKTPKLGSAGNVIDSGGGEMGMQMPGMKPVMGDMNPMHFHGQLPQHHHGNDYQTPEAVRPDANSPPMASGLSSPLEKQRVSSGFNSPVDEKPPQSVDGSISEASESPNPGALVVVDRETGRKLTGSSAPQLKDIASWLESHPSFDVSSESANLVREKGNLPASLKSRMQPAGNGSKPSANHPFFPHYGDMGYYGQYNGNKAGFNPNFMPGALGGYHYDPYNSFGGMPPAMYDMYSSMHMHQQGAQAPNTNAQPSPTPSTKSAPSSSSPLFSSTAYGSVYSGHQSVGSQPLFPNYTGMNNEACSSSNSEARSPGSDQSQENSPTDSSKSFDFTQASGEEKVDS